MNVHSEQTDYIELPTWLSREHLYIHEVKHITSPRGELFIYFSNVVNFDSMTYLNFSSPHCSSNLPSLCNFLFPLKVVKEPLLLLLERQYNKNWSIRSVTAFQCESSLWIWTVENYKYPLLLFLKFCCSYNWRMYIFHSTLTNILIEKLKVLLCRGWVWRWITKMTETQIDKRV